MSYIKIIKRITVFIGLFILGFILHTSVFGNIKIGVVVPNVFLVITAALGFMKGSIWGMLFGFLSGIVVDSFSLQYFGFNCLVYVIIGYLNGMCTRFFFGDDVRLPVVLVGISDFLFGNLTYAFLFLIRQRVDYEFFFMNIIMPEAVYSVIVFLILYYPLVKAFDWMDKDPTRRTVR